MIQYDPLASEADHANLDRHRKEEVRKLQESLEKMGKLLKDPH